MFSELMQQLESKNYWFNVLNRDNTIILNVEDPEEALPTLRRIDGRPTTPQPQWKLGNPAVMTVQVLKYELLVRWANPDAAYDETWEFETVAEFMKFLDKFLEDGIDEMMDYANEMAKADD